MPHNTPEKKSAYMAKRYQDKRDQLIAYQASYRQGNAKLRDKQRFRHLTGTAAVKMMLILDHGGRCQQCSESDWRVLQFHHRDPEHKEFCVTRGSLADLSVLRNEADKCDLLCGHCHTRLHVTITEEETDLFVRPMAEQLQQGLSFTEARNLLWPERKYAYPRKFPLEDIERIRSLYWDESMTLKEIADLYDATDNSLHSFMRKHGIPLRTPKEAAQLRYRKQLVQGHVITIEDADE